MCDGTRYVLCITYTRYCMSCVIPEWLFIRLTTLLEFESDLEQPGVRAYYKQLQMRDGQRAMGYKRDND